MRRIDKRFFLQSGTAGTANKLDSHVSSRFCLRPLRVLLAASFAALYNAATGKASEWRNQLLALFCLLVFAGAGRSLFSTLGFSRKPFGIILFIGEGLPLSRTAPTRAYAAGAGTRLNVDSMALCRFGDELFERISRPRTRQLPQRQLRLVREWPIAQSRSMSTGKRSRASLNWPGNTGGLRVS